MSDEKIVYAKYFYESLIPYSEIDFSNCKNVLDIGSGSGIPGILLKLIHPHIKLQIIEATGKKVEFMKQLVQKLGLDGVIVSHQRAEEIKDSDREKFDLVTSRAVAELKVILEVSAPYAKVNGLIIEPKSTNYLTEQKNANNIIKSLHLLQEADVEFISVNKILHHVLIYKKMAKTDKKYPRSWKVITK